MKKILFEESQRHNILIALIPGGIAALIFGCLSYVQVVLHHPVGNHPAPTWLLLLFFLGSLAGVAVFSLQTLKLKITRDEIEISFGVFAQKRIIKMSDVKAINVRKYDALKEFWGWGVRFNARGKCYTVSGDEGIDIELSNGERILVGTKKMAEADKAISALIE